MNPLASKYKIYIASLAWIVLCGAAFGYGFNILDHSNKILSSDLANKKKEYSLLEAEQKSFQMAKRDLDDLENEPVQPDDLFSRDVTLVNEIRELEAMGEESGVELNLSGIRGTIGNAAKAGTKGEIYTIPYVITVNGPFTSVLQFVERLEHVDFISPVFNISVTSAANNGVNATLTASFYIKNKAEK